MLPRSILSVASLLTHVLALPACFLVSVFIYRSVWTVAYLDMGVGRLTLNTLMLMCIIDGKIAGNCQLTFYTGIKRKHRADVAIALLKEYWGLGIGTRMFREMIRIAEENENIIQLELDVVEGNTRAMRLYEKMGFVITGELPNAIRLKDGTLLSDFKMIRKIERNNG